MTFSGERTPGDDPAFKPIREQQRAAYSKALEYVEGLRVLEIGCGEAVGASILASKAASVVALDYSRETIQAARERYAGTSIEFVLMKVPPIEFDADSFDAVVCFQMIEHLEEPGGLVEEIKRVVGDRGVALFSTINKEETFADNPYHLHEFGPDEFREFLERYFNHVELHGVFGDEVFMKYRERNQRWVSALMRMDIFNLVDRIPQGLKRWLYDTVGTFMRNRLKNQDPSVLEEITYKNFSFRSGELAGCLDLFAACSTTKITPSNQ